MKSRLYEVLIALDTSVASGDAEAFLARLQSMVKDAKGEVKELDKQGLRKLAFKVKGKSEAQFYALRYEAPTDVVQQIESALRLNEGVVRYMTTRLEPSQLLPSTTEARPAHTAATKAPETPAPQSTPTTPAS